MQRINGYDLLPENKIDREYLVDSDNFLYYYNNKPFTGIAYTLDIFSDATENKYYEYGVYIKEYKNKYFPKLKEDTVYAVYSALTENDSSYNGEPVIYVDEVFTGVAYEFINDICVRELLYEEGKLIAFVSYYKNGKIKEVESFHKEIMYNFEWNKEGILKEVYIKTKEEFYIEIRYNDNSELINLSLEKIDFDLFSNLKEKLNLPILTDKEFFKDIKIGELLILSGELIDDKIFNYLFENNKIENLLTLRLLGTKLTTNSFSKLKKLIKLKKIKIRSNDCEIKELLEDIKGNEFDNLEEISFNTENKDLLSLINNELNENLKLYIYVNDEYL